MTIDILEIMAMLPHRYPLLLVDKVLEYELNKSIIGIKNVTFNEPHFTGHFPNKPIMPGVLIIEAMAQLSAILVAKSISSCKEKDVYFMSIDGAKFRKVIQPGDTMYLYAELQQNRGSVWKFSARAEVNKELVAESTFTAMVKDR